MTDNIYILNKQTHALTLVGEIQTEFNMSFVIDGTKDSAKLELVSYSLGDEIEPYTIVWHENTDTWWIASSDRVERVVNEQGFYYTHRLQLNGAIELLNARDLTDCGFNANTYTYEEFIRRLFTLSNFEFELNNIVFDRVFNIQKKVDYIKSFENYTLLSALREFLDGYNADCILTFQPISSVYKTNLQVFSKTGRDRYVFNGTNITLNQLNADTAFNQYKEIKNMNKNSFGSIVVSNAENVVSTKAKTFPNNGGTKLSSQSLDIVPNQAILRLPSKIYKVNWLKMFVKRRFIFSHSTIGDWNQFSFYWDCNVFDVEGIKSQLLNRLKTLDAAPMIENIDEIAKNILLASTITFYNLDNYDPQTYNFIKPNNVPYIPEIYRYLSLTQSYHGQLGLTTKEVGQNVRSDYASIWWERGKDYIEHFDALCGLKARTGYPNTISYSTDFQGEDDTIFEYGDEVEKPYWAVTVDWVSGFGDNIDGYGILNVQDTLFQVNYIPMSDLKVKYDNNGETFDTKLYNQNGKLTDSVALSKLMLSYSDEIEKDSITKYAVYTDTFDNLPKVGQRVLFNNGNYVINNASYDFYPTENRYNQSKVTYYFECEFTISKEIGVKSLMVNPNTNVRDYGIPQTENIKRKQLYRDFYELTTHGRESNNYDYYMQLRNYMPLTIFQKEISDHTAIMQLTYDEQIGSSGNESTTWYYQLDTTAYVLKKAYYEVVDFKDNNIIGYDNQSVYGGFDIRRIFSGTYDTINVPISYVDDNGKFKGIKIAFCNNEQLSYIYDKYTTYMKSTYGSSWNGNLQNRLVFIDYRIYDGAASLTFSINNRYSGFVDPFVNENYVDIDITNELNALAKQFFNSIDTIYCLYYDQVDGATQTITGNNFETALYKDGSNYYLRVTKVTDIAISDNFEILLTTLLVSGNFGASANKNHDFVIWELNYNKDAIEVPFFEYSCQIDDTDDVCVGDNIFDFANQKSNQYNVYTYVIADKGKYNANYYPIGDENISYNVLNGINANNGVSFTMSDRGMSVRLHQSVNVRPLLGTVTYGNVRNMSNIADWSKKDLVIVRQRMTFNADGTTSFESDLMFVFKDMQHATIDDNYLLIEINHYKLR